MFFSVITTGTYYTTNPSLLLLLLFGQLTCMDSTMLAKRIESLAAIFAVSTNKGTVAEMFR